MANVLTKTTTGYTNLFADEYPIQSITGVLAEVIAKYTGVYFSEINNKWVISGAADPIEGVTMKDGITDDITPIWVSGSFIRTAINIDATLTSEILANGQAVAPIFIKDLDQGL